MPYSNSLPRVFFSLIVILALAACDNLPSPGETNPPVNGVTAVEIRSLDERDSTSCNFETLECEITAANAYFGVDAIAVGEGSFNQDVTFSFSNPIAYCDIGEYPNYCTVNAIDPAQSGTTILTVASVQDPSKTARVGITISIPSSNVVEVSSLQADPQTAIVEGSSLSVRYTWRVAEIAGTDLTCTFRIAFSDYVETIEACVGEQTLDYVFASYQNFHYASLDVRDSQGNAVQREHTFLAEPAFSILRAINTARSQARDCGETLYPAIHPVRWDERLASAARQHSQDMAQRDYFSHESPEGEGPGERISAAGYDWSTHGENISAGRDNHDAALASWLTSSGHCRNIMSATMRDVGVGYGNDASSTWQHYWTQKFATQR